MIPPADRKDNSQRYEAIKQSMGDVRGKSLLDIGCANGYFMARFLADGGLSALGVDTSLEMRQSAENFGLSVVDGIEMVDGNFDFCLFLDLQFHGGIDYVDFCKEKATVTFIAPSGDGRVNNERLFDIISKKFKVSKILQTDYAHRMIYRCE